MLTDCALRALVVDAFNVMSQFFEPSTGAKYRSDDDLLKWFEAFVQSLKLMHCFKHGSATGGSLVDAVCDAVIVCTF
jgi:hypothetical protein